MRQASKVFQPAEPGFETALGLKDQVSRDARTRVIASAAVVLVHAAYPPGHPALASLSPDGQEALAAVSTVLSSFPVNTFVLLSFLGLAPRLRTGVPAGRLLGTLVRRLGVAHLFWAGAFLAARAALERELPSPRTVLEGVVLGTAADHLYFVPVLLALTAASPALAWLARTPRDALTGGLALALAGIALRVYALEAGDPWTRAAAGVLGFAPFAVAGLALAEWWGGRAPGPERAAAVVPAAALVTLASAATLVGVVSHAGRAADASFSLAAWLGVNGCALGIPVLLLSFGGRASPRLVRLAGSTLGVYFVHPFFAQLLRRGEARLEAVAGLEPLLIVPNAIATVALSLAALAVLARTPLRRVVM
jgi:surface polysaccharide O-acyltransferase-like enzyme